jgi:hypothetical protein
MYGPVVVLRNQNTWPATVLLVGKTPAVRMGEVRLRGLSISIDAVRISRREDDSWDGNFRNQKARLRWSE